MLLRLYDASFAVMDQTDDHSYNCSTPGAEIVNPLFTAYVKGVLVFGTEPR